VIAEGADQFEQKRKTTGHNQSRNDGNYVKRIVNQNESPTDIIAGSAEYVSDAAEISRRKLAAKAVNLNVVKILEYGDNIENRIDGRSLLADQS